MDEKLLVQTLLRHRPAVVAFVRAILRDMHTAEDIFQDISLMAVEGRAQFRDAGHLAAWLRTAAKHRALNAIRDRKVGPVHLDAAVVEQLDAHWPAAPGVSGEISEALARCMEQLSEYAHRLIVLRHEQDLSGEVLAAAVGGNAASVAVALSRTRRKLHNCIRERLAEGRR